MPAQRSAGNTNGGTDGGTNSSTISSNTGGVAPGSTGQMELFTLQNVWRRYSADGMEVLYRTARTGGPDHEPAWRATCVCSTPRVWVECAGVAKSKRAAKEMAARRVLAHLQHAAGVEVGAAAAAAGGGTAQAPAAASDAAAGQRAPADALDELPEAAAQLRVALLAARAAQSEGGGADVGAPDGGGDDHTEEDAPEEQRRDQVARQQRGRQGHGQQQRKAQASSEGAKGAEGGGGSDASTLPQGSAAGTPAGAAATDAIDGAVSEEVEDGDVLQPHEARRAEYKAMMRKAGRLGAYLEPRLRPQHQRAWAAAGVMPYHVITDDDGNVVDVLLLFGRQGKQKKLNSKLGEGNALLILGGKREPRDLGPRHTAAREVAEETGRLLFGGRQRRVRGPVLWFPAGKYAVFLHHMPATRDLPTRFMERVASNESDGEISALEWVPLGDIVRRPWEHEVSWFLMKVLMTGLIEAFFADGQYLEWVPGAGGSTNVVVRQNRPSRRFRRTLRGRGTQGGARGSAAQVNGGGAVDGEQESTQSPDAADVDRKRRRSRWRKKAPRSGPDGK